MCVVRHEWEALALSPLALLPRAVVETILTSPGVGTKERKALRQVCRLFRHALDGYMVHGSVLSSHRHDVKAAWLCRMQRAGRIKSLSMCVISMPDSRLLELLPTTLTSVRLSAVIASVEPLRALPRLTALSILNNGSAPVLGLDALKGLTSLETDRHVGSIEHLAPSLRRLRIRAWSDVEGIESLDCLRELEVVSGRDGVPRNALQRLSHLPLQHLSWQPGDDTLNCDRADEWVHCPDSLSSVVVANAHARFTAAALQHTAVTKLVLAWPSADVLRQAMAALPRLETLGYSQVVAGRDGLRDSRSALDGLTSLRHLRHLAMWVWCDGAPRDVQWVYKELPAVAAAAARGVRVTAVTGEREEIERSPWAPVWPTTSHWQLPGAGTCASAV